MSKFWIKTSFWENVKKTIAIFAAPATLGINEASHTWALVTMGVSIVGAVLAIWFTDNNKDGVVDLFQE